MTKKELLARLQDCPDDMQIGIKMNETFAGWELPLRSAERVTREGFWFPPTDIILLSTEPTT